MMRRAAFFVLFGLLAGVFTLAYAPLAHGQCTSRFAVRSSYVPTTYSSYVNYQTVIDPIYAAVFVPVPAASVGAAPITSSLPPPTTAGGPVPAGTSPAGMAAATERAGSSGQGSPTAAVGTSPCDAQVKELRKEVEELKAALKAVVESKQTGAATARGAEPTPAPALSVLQQSCFACHGRTADKDAVKGGKVFRFSDDGASLRADAPVLKMLTLARRGTMPPADNDRHVAPLTDDGYSQLESELLDPKKEAKP